MSAKQVKETEDIVLDIIASKHQVFAKETPLSLAKEIQGLRAVFDEVSSQGMSSFFPFYLFSF